MGRRVRNRLNGRGTAPASAEAEGIVFVLVCPVEEKSPARIERQIGQRFAAAATRSSFRPVPFRLLLRFLQEALGLSHVIGLCSFGFRFHLLLEAFDCKCHFFLTLLGTTPWQLSATT
jgi:hypothetical protein